MSAPIDCPICMDCIETTSRNCVTTECGHCFHTNCLMQSVAHNGFGCPYCRSVMAEVPEEEETDYDEDEEEEEVFNDDALRGFRFFFNNINGEAHDEDDIADEDEAEEWESSAFNDEAHNENTSIPSTDFVAQKLKDQGVTFEQIVNMLCGLNHDEFQGLEEPASDFENELYGKVRRILANYTPEQPVPVMQHLPVESHTIAQTSIDFEAQPKVNKVNIIRRIELECF